MMKWLKPGGYYIYRQFHIQQFYVSSQMHTKHINTLCGQNVALLNVKLAVHIVTTGL
jgi:hypothetical protein